ncbi:hypothetical protein BELL_0025g00080 [Botrytis elliptica]|uniref:Uncharacterized protein n=1 Tax=Botrytis elliptica TaxID=278938 RepID=A0A4Z1K1C1_9HELO|nr:hypothetical protein BELL_0025g00080 [Botrytis elliptica]
MPLMPVLYRVSLPEFLRLCVRKEDAARTPGVSLDSSLVWNLLLLTSSASASTTPPQSHQPKEHDKLPPYNELSSDEQREKKASYCRPGMYTLAVIPESFDGLLEYETKSSRPRSFGTNRHRFQSTRPDVVILERFVGYPGSRSQSENPLSRKASLEKVSSPSELPITLVDRETDSYLLDHYRNVLANQICWLAEQASGPDIFERYSADYPPVAATGHREYNMWEQHSDRILRILQLRQKAYGKEPHGFIIVFTSYIDMYALLTTTGTGSFSKAILKQDMLPPPEDALENRSLNMIFVPEAIREMPDLLRMNRELTLIALEMARAGRSLKFEEKDDSKPRIEVNMNRCRSMQDLYTRLMEFRDNWSGFVESKTPEESWLRELAQLPSGPFTCRTHLFYRACEIYYHTSMYQGQSLIIAAEVEEQLSSCAREIILIAKTMIDLGRLGARFVVFPIFMAGIASRVKEEKQSALEFLRRLEETSFGSNTTTTRKLLASIIKKQEIAIAETGNPLCVSWIEELESSGQQLILVGL